MPGGKNGERMGSTNKTNMGYRNMEKHAGITPLTLNKQGTMYTENRTMTVSVNLRYKRHDKNTK